MNIPILDIRDKLPVNKKRLAMGGKIPLRKGDISRIVIHCSADDDKPGEDVYGLAKYDINPNHISSKGCFTFTYHYYIEQVGGKIRIYRCVDNNTVTWHVGKWNKDSIAIGVDKRGEDEAPEKYKVAVWLAAKLCKELGLTQRSVVFHRELEGTGWFWRNGKKVYRKSCPGWGWKSAGQFRKDVATMLMPRRCEKLLRFFRFVRGSLGLLFIR